MKTSEINNSLIGKRVNGVFLAMPVTGTIIATVEGRCPVTNDLCSKGVLISLDKPVYDGTGIYTQYESTSRVYDDWGNLSHTHIID